MRTIGFLVFLIFLSGCKATKETASKVQDDGQISFVIIQMNDVYEIAPLGGGKYGGMARVAHIKDSIAAINPNTYMVMAGDFLNPSLIGTLKLDGERINGRQMVEVMNTMGVDLTTFGNHEFDVGRESLQKRINESTFAWTVANVLEDRGEGNTAPFRINRDIGNIPIKPYHVWSMTDADGTNLKIGFVSACLDSNPQDFVVYGEIIPSLEKALSLVSPQTDLQLGLTHLTIEQDKRVAARFPELKLIMGGHEHNNMLVPAGNINIAKADANAKTIYIHTFNYNKLSGELTIDSDLFPIDESIKSAADTEAVVNKWQDILETKLKEVVADPYEVIYKATTPLDGTDSASRSVQTNLGGMITQAITLGFEEPAQAGLVNGGSIRIDDMLAGDITSLDIFRVLPFGGYAVKVDMTGSLLIKTLDYGIEKRGKGAYLQRYNIDRNQAGVWTLGGLEIDPEGVYSIAMTDFLLKGYDIPFLKEDNPEILGVYKPTQNEPTSDIRRAVIEFIKKQQA